MSSAPHRSSPLIVSSLPLARSRSLVLLSVVAMRCASLLAALLALVAVALAQSVSTGVCHFTPTAAGPSTLAGSATFVYTQGVRLSSLKLLLRWALALTLALSLLRVGSALDHDRHDLGHRPR